MRSVGHPLLDHVGPVPFPAVQSIFDRLFVPGLQWYWRADNFTELSDEAIAPPRGAWIEDPDHALDHASLSRKWRGAARRPE